MATTSTIDFTLLFEDDTTGTISLGPFASNNSGLYSLKTNLQDFINNQFTEEIKNSMVSKYGAKWVGFNRVRVTTSQITTIF